MNIQKPKGTKDIFENIKEWEQLENIIKSICEFYNYSEIRTPIFESLDLFKRSVGDTTDVVSKEMYDFKDKGDRSMALRPENTAGTIRAYVENKMYGTLNGPTKLFYMGPQFRYERPQNGRQRQFNQFGVEAIGVKSPKLDVEQILLAYSILKYTGLNDLEIQINTLGDVSSRETYRKELRTYLSGKEDQLCEDCKSRIDSNVLRVLDCKVCSEKDIVKNAPKLMDSLTQESKDYFAVVTQALTDMDIPFAINDKLVRGLDYYTDTVFEIVSKAGERPLTICGGGRYDNLVKQLGGPDVSGVGFAMGMERIINMLADQKIELSKDTGIDAFIVTLSDAAADFAIPLASMLRSAGFKTDLDFTNGSFKAQFKAVDRLNATFALIVGDEELKNGTIKVKNQITKEEKEVKIDDLVEYLDGGIANENTH